MSSAQITELFKSAAVLSAFLFLGMFLRAKVKLFRDLLLPASVIGGFILLIIGPNVLNIYPVSADYMKTWAAVPGIFIVPIFASVPLGNGWNKPPKDPNAPKQGFKIPDGFSKGLIAFSCFSMAGGFQSVLGFGFNLLATNVFGMDLYRTFGSELNSGFSGGHGTAGAIGNTLQGYGVEYWQTAQSVATTFATIGLIGGIALGIFILNRKAAKGETRILDKPGSIPDNVLYGFEKDITKHGNLGRETTHNSSIETVTVHLGLLIIITGVSYVAQAWCVKNNIWGISSLTVWFYGLIIMYPTNWAIQKLGLTWMFDTKVKSKVTGCLTDYAIICAIASMNVSAVLSYAMPIIILSVLGFIFTYFFVFVYYRWAVGPDDFPVERAIINWGFMTGVLITGILLLKIADPNYDSPVMEDFSFGMAISSFTGLFTSPIYYTLLGTGTTMANFLYALGCFCLWCVCGVTGHALLKKEHPEQFHK